MRKFADFTLYILKCRVVPSSIHLELCLQCLSERTPMYPTPCSCMFKYFFCLICLRDTEAWILEPPIYFSKECLFHNTSKHPGNDNMSPAQWTLWNWLAKVNNTTYCSRGTIGTWWHSKAKSRARRYVVTVEAYITSHRKNSFQLVQVNKCFMFWILLCDIHWFMSAPKTDNFWRSFIHSTYYFKPIIQTLLHFFFYKNVVFPAQAEYFYFFADFRLEIFLYYS